MTEGEREISSTLWRIDLAEKRPQESAAGTGVAHSVGSFKHPSASLINSSKSFYSFVCSALVCSRSDASSSVLDTPSRGALHIFSSRELSSFAPEANCRLSLTTSDRGPFAGDEGAVEKEFADLGLDSLCGHDLTFAPEALGRLPLTASDRGPFSGDEGVVEKDLAELGDHDLSKLN